MSEKLQCPHCDAPIRTNAPIPAGKKIRCPKCQEVFQPGNKAKPEAVEKEEKRPTRPRPPVRDVEDTPPPKSKGQAPREDRDEPEDSDEEDRPARKKKRKKEKKGGKGMLIALIAGGGAVLLIAIVLGLGFALGWFGGSGSTGIVKPGPGPGPGPEPGPGPIKKGPSAVAQAVFDRITLNIREMSLAQMQKEFTGNRDAGAAEVDALFDKVAFRDRIFADFQKNRNELKVKQWIFIEREGDIIVCGMSQFKDGQTRVSMLGHYSPSNAAYFNMTPRGSGDDIK